MVRQSPNKQTNQNTPKPIRGTKPGSKPKTKQFQSIHKDIKQTTSNVSEDRHKLFVLEYMKELNASKAYKAVYGDGPSADVRGSQLLKNVKVAELVCIAKQERMKETKIDANYVLKRLREIDEMDALDILEDDGSVKPIRDWPKIWRQFISGFEISTMMSKKDDSVIASVLKKIKWPDKTKNLELIGKHVNVQAFRERIELGNKDGNPFIVSLFGQAVTPGSGSLGENDDDV